MTIVRIAFVFFLLICAEKGQAQSYADSLRTRVFELDSLSLLGIHVPGGKAERLFCGDMMGFAGVDGSFQTAVRNSYKSVFAIRGQGGPVIDGDWSFLGPSIQPKELNPGGKAIPTYAEGRGNGTGRINFLYQDPTLPNRMFACSPTGGLFVSQNQGISWGSAGTDHLPISGVSSIAVNPQNPDAWLISTGDGDDKFMFSDGIWRTNDAGASWENINGSKFGRSLLPSENATNHLYIAKILAHPCDFNRVFAATSAGLYVTNNALDPTDKIKWKKIDDSFYFDLLIPEDDEGLVYASGERFKVSYDCGNSWKELPFPAYPKKAEFKFARLVLQSAGERGQLFGAVTCAQQFSQSPIGEGTLWLFDLKTKKWDLVRSLSQGMNNLITTRARAFAVKPSNSNLIMVANVQPIYRSLDGGANFERIERNQMHDDVHHLLWIDERVYAGHDGGISVSYDEGLTWETSDQGIGAANVFGLSVANTEETQVLYGAYDTGGNLLKDDAWFHVTWGDGFETIIDSQNPDEMYATKQNGHINRSTDGGNDFNRSITSSRTKTEWHTWIKAHPTKNGVLYCSGDKLMRTMNKGEVWESILDVKKVNGTFGRDYVTVFRFFTSEHHPEVIYAYVLDQTKVNPVLLRTKNATTSDPAYVKWEVVPQVPRPGWIMGMAIDADDPEQFWITYKNVEPEGKVYRFNGQRYVDVTANLGWCLIESIVLDKSSEERIYIGSNHGVFTRDKREETWTLLEGLPGTYIRSLAINYQTRTLFAGTFGRGIWLAPLLP
ncbi:MAG: hypothetical protein ACI80P_001221 [Flavobacteriales bacterium]|jgi:hypothetical protein